MEIIDEAFAVIGSDRLRIKALLADVKTETAAVYRLIDTFAKDKKALTKQQMKAFANFASTSQRRSGSYQTLLQCYGDERLAIIQNELFSVNTDYAVLYNELNAIVCSQQAAISEMNAIITTARACQAVLNLKPKTAPLYDNWQKNFNLAVVTWDAFRDGIVAVINEMYGIAFALLGGIQQNSCVSVI